MNLVRYAFAVATLACLTLSVSCGADDRDKLGGVGEVCFRDTDCDGELICQSRICAELGSGPSPTNNTSNNTSNNSTNNSTNNVGCDFQTQDCVCDATGGNCRPYNNVEPLGCEELCDYVVTCFEDDFPDSYDECVNGCRREIGSRQDIDAVARCFLEYSCDQILRGQGEECLSP